MSFPTTATLSRLLSQYGVIFLNRAQWGATAPRGPLMPGYARGVHVHHSVTIADDDENYKATEDVVADMREIERIGVQRFNRFSYSWAIHPSGVVAEGAGFTIGAHTENFNSSTFGIVFIGNLDRDPLTKAAKAGFKALVNVLRVSDALTEDSYFKPHRARKATACPGQHVMDDWLDLINVKSLPVPARPVPPTPQSPLETTMIFHITNSPYTFLLKDAGLVPLTEAEFWELAGIGVPVKSIPNEKFVRLNRLLQALAQRPLHPVS